MNPNPVHNPYVQEKIEQRRDMPMGRDVPNADSLHSRAPEGRVGCGPAVIVLLIVFVLVALASSNGNGILALLY